MLAAVVNQIQRHVASSNPAAALLTLECLGWGQAQAHTIPCPGLPALDRLVLGSYPTQATVARAHPNGPADAIGRMAYFAGHRWCIEVYHGAITWHDFSTSETWTAPASELSAEPLRGFTPNSFAQSGRFEPWDVRRSIATNIPREDATEYLFGRIDTWWHRWLADHASPDRVDSERERFVRLLSALLLLKTIEDLGRVDWLSRGTLSHATRSRTQLPKLLRKCAHALNSRILRSVAELADDTDRVVPLVNALEESEIDFASLEIDPVGIFYEQVLGTAQTLVIPQQQTLPLLGYGNIVVDDVSVRRRQGAFFTPRSYADVLAHHLVLPDAQVAASADELPSILDLAAGSGQLLCAALREIFGDSEWRRPDTARKVLAEKIWAVDMDPKAVHLAALNVLRTTIRLVPEILDDGSPLPAMDRNFIVGDATNQRVLDQLPTADIALLNPPFKGRTQWSPLERNGARALRDLQGPVNLAFAFLSIALGKVREGGGVGAIMASQLFSGVQHQQIREQIASQLRIETLVVNHGSPFPDALSYAGLLIGHRLQNGQLPHAEVITVPGGVRNGAADLAAILFSASGGTQGQKAGATTEMVSIAADALGNWTSTSALAVRRPSRRSPKIPLASVLIDGIHQGVVAAPKPWGFELFLFEERKEGVAHRLNGGAILDDRTSALRAFSRPRMLQGRVPNLCEPVVPGLRVFLPGDGGPMGVTIRTLEQRDSVASRLAKVIRDRVVDTRVQDFSSRATAFTSDVQNGKLRFNCSNAFIDQASPQVIISQATRSPVGSALGVRWSAWVNTDGAVVPLEGLRMRTISVEYAIVVAVLLNIPDAIDAIVNSAPFRNMGTKKPRLETLRGFELPDLDSRVYHSALSELVDVFQVYRRKVKEVSPAAALATREYRELLRLGTVLWRP